MTNHPIERETHPMVERVARAIRKCDAFVGDPHEAVDMALAALSVLREPTPDMLEAAGKVEVDFAAYPAVNDRRIFTAMLNTIIGDGA